MTSTNWANINTQGRALARAFKRTQQKLEQTDDVDDFCKLCNTLGYLSQSIRSLAKDDIERRVTELEKQMQGRAPDGQAGT